MYQKIHAMYFSPTGTTKRVVTSVAETLLKQEHEVHTIDFTSPASRNEPVSFSKNDLVVVGVPVYAGRVPNVLLKFLNTIQGNGAVAVAVVVHGNRNFDDALIELKDILEEDGFQVAAAGAFIGEHSFSKVLAAGRPDEQDSAVARDFGTQIAKKLSASDAPMPLEVKGCKPYRPYYRPRDPQGNPVDIRKVTPKTNDKCIQCKLCVEVCPMGSIDFDDPSKLVGICIKCGACIKCCPENAKYYDDEAYLRHTRELEAQYAARREPELFV